MKFEVSETTRVYRKEGWVETQKAFTRREQDEVREEFHDMTLGETREVVPGIEITRIE